MNIRNQKLTAIVIVILLVIASTLVITKYFNRGVALPEESAREGIIKSPQVGASQQQGGQSVSPESAATAGSTATSAKISEYLCEGKGCGIADPLSARTREEALWLIRNGYPSASDLKAWSLLSDDQLKRVADGGSLAAKAVYGERIALKGDMTGLNDLLASANSGSIYSYYGTSRVYAKSNAIDGAAFLRVAYMLGDSRASGALMDSFPRFGPADYYVIDRRAAELYKSYARARTPVPRP